MDITKPNTDLNELNPAFREKVELFLKEVGDKIRVTEGYRSQDRQNWLYEQGRTRPGKIVTKTRYSQHKKRNAIDICFRGNDPYPSDIEKWREIANVAIKYGIDWGYDLRTWDMPHFQDNLEPLDMEEFEKLFKTGSSKGECHIVNDVDGFVKKWETMPKSEQAYYLMIMFNRLKKK